jgi:lichenan operon transcriptional antiterminator
VYEAALIVANGIANHYSIRLSDGEIGLVCMHVGMLVGEVDARPVEIAILSSPYLSIARRIGDLLCERFGSRVVVKAFGGLGDAPSVSSDIVVLTGESDAIPLGMAVKVSPLFGESDFRRVERAIQRVERRREIAKNDEMGSFLDPRFFFLADDFEPRINSREEAISLLCSRMREAGLVGELFEESVRERERAAPTAFGGRFAIPHATRMDARRTVVGVLVSRGGIAWGGSCVNVVLLLLAVSATDRQRFVSIFDALAQALWGEGEVARLSRCESFGEFRDELRAGMCLR